jgi:3-hydroxy-3-methylglutaryl CoA synthase
MVLQLHKWYGSIPDIGSVAESVRVSGDSVGIRSYGVCVPRLRISRSAIADAHAWALPGLKGLARGERAFCSWDEDAVTLAVHAARECLGAVPGEHPGDVAFASTTAPFAEPQNASIVARALRLPATVTSEDFAGSTRAGLRALALALEAGDAGQRLIVAADNRHAKPGSAQEMSYGAGGAAILTGGDDLLARYLGRHSVAVPFVDHFRESAERYDYYWEERWIRDEGVARIVPSCVKALLERIDRTPERVAWLGLAGAPVGCDAMVARALGIPADRVVPDLQATVGDTGTAHALMLLASAIERGRPGDLVVIAAFGLGCEALAFEIADGGARPAGGLGAAIDNREVETSYLKLLSFAGELRLDWGPRSETQIKASLTQQYRAADQLLGFVGGRCGACGQVQFPVLPSCVGCGAAGAQAPYPLADERARVATVSADWLQFYPAPPLHVGLVQFDVGARALMEIVDVPLSGVEVGTPLRFVFRLKAHDEVRHYSRYFWKAVPAR